jgi:hypothetical protein
MSERDLFKAIVLSGAALVSVPGCGGSTPPADSGATQNDAGGDAAVVVADAGRDADNTTHDAGDAGDETDTGMVLIL